MKISKVDCKNVKKLLPNRRSFRRLEIINLILKSLGKNEDLSNFGSLRKKISLIPNFTKLNELPKFKESIINDMTLNFTSEEVQIKELDYFFTNAISRASKTMSECRQVKLSSKKTGTDNL